MAAMDQSSIPPESLATAVFLVLALGAAGVVHSLWLRAKWSAQFAGPIDLGLTIRGRRLFGDNKTWRGLMVMPIAAGAVFFLAATFRSAQTSAR